MQESHSACLLVGRLFGAEENCLSYFARYYFFGDGFSPPNPAQFDYLIHSLPCLSFECLQSLAGKIYVRLRDFLPDNYCCILFGNL